MRRICLHLWKTFEHVLQEEIRENKVEVYHNGSVLVVQFRTKLNSLR